MLNKLLFWKKQNIIEFYCHPDHFGVIPEPKMAAKDSPKWFKKLGLVTEDGHRDNFGAPAQTAKHCKPLVDAFSCGFTIHTAGDVRIQTNHDCSKIVVTNPPILKVVEFHMSSQVGGNSSLKKNHGDPLKFINYWNIKTAPGWSTLFIPPVNNFELPFTCLSGMVDTDLYDRTVNFPAIWHIPNYDGTIPAGTPLVTAIPIKRKSFNKRPIVRKMTNQEFHAAEKTALIQQTRNHYYTENIWVKK